MSGQKEIEFEIIKHVGTLNPESAGWVTELNIVSWNGCGAKYDLRSWSPDHSKMSKGITLTPDELSNLGDLIDAIDFGVEDGISE